jgi:hypothetical protein
VLQHDSLLAHVEDEVLTPEERREAWDEYENKRDAPVVDLTNNMQNPAFNWQHGNEVSVGGVAAQLLQQFMNNLGWNVPGNGHPDQPIELE